MTRIFLAALLGAIAMFIWTSIAHMALPLGEAGIREIPNETGVLSALQGNIAGQPGLYLFPGLGLGSNPTHERKSEAMKNMGATLARYPSGLLIYHPAGSRPLMMVRWLLIEFATEFLEALHVVLLLSQTRLTTFGARWDSSLLGESSRPSPPMSPIGIGTVSRLFIPSPACSPSSSASFASE